MRKQLKHSLTNEILTPLVGLSVFLSVFLWQSGTNKTLWLRRVFLYIAGFIALLALVYIRKQIRLSRYTALALTLLIALSTVSLLGSGPIARGLIGQPIAHPSLLSLYSSIAVGLLFAAYANKKKFLAIFYLALVAFTALNLIYWLTHGLDSRLGFLGVQLNYTAYLTVIGLIIGVWAYAKSFIPACLVYSAQVVLLIAALLTQSRVAILLALISAGYFIYRLYKDNRKTAFMGAISILILLLVVVGYSSHFSRVHNQRYLDTSVIYRVDLIKSAIPANKTQLILGSGIGGLERNIGSNGHRYAPINKDLKTGWRFESSHNYPVDVLVERGAIVLVLYITLIAGAIKQGFHSKDIEQKLLLYLLLATLVFWFFNNLNIQAELIMWCCVLGLLAKGETRHLSTSTQKTI